MTFLCGGRPGSVAFLSGRRHFPGHRSCRETCHVLDLLMLGLGAALFALAAGYAALLERL